MATSKKLNRNGYSEEDQEREIYAVYRQQMAVHNPDVIEREKLEKLLNFYIEGNDTQ
jgi:hypothetical protein